MATNQRKTEKPAESAEEAVIEQAPLDLDTPSGKYVKHNPMQLFSARRINKADWESIRVMGQSGVEWNAGNNFTLPVELFTKQALNYLEKRDDGFEIVTL